MFKNIPENPPIVLGKTPKGKEIQAVQSHNSLYKIQFKKGGELPNELLGEYTDLGSAERVVKNYISRLTKNDSLKISE